VATYSFETGGGTWTCVSALRTLACCSLLLTLDIRGDVAGHVTNADSYLRGVALFALLVCTKETSSIPARRHINLVIA
jgi:hypothetical protein